MNRGYLGVWALVSLFALNACGDSKSDEDGNSKGNGDGDGDADSGGDGDGDGDDTSTCSDTMCDGDCAVLLTSDEHCGNCETQCGPYESCQTGSCVQTSCPDSLTLCDTGCEDTTSDLLHCGDCENACPLSFTCATSDCSCEGSRIECAGYCSHPDFDRQHCGGCADSGGTVCEADEACVGGTCEEIAVPEVDYCSITETWDADYTAREFEILDIVNRRRAEGATCGDEYFAPTDPLQMDASLRCAARVHNQDMVANNYFSHDNLVPEGPGPRLTKAGYSGNGWGENISAGNSTAEAAMAGWMNSPGHCSNIMNPDFALIGVGYTPGGDADYGHYWTQTFGRN